MAISANGSINEVGRSLEFHKPQLPAKGTIYRVTTRDQIVSLADGIIHLPPVPANKQRIEAIFMMVSMLWQVTAQSD